MRYFDFHAHVILKQLFDETPNIDALIYRDDLKNTPKDCTDLPYIIQTQIHQSQLANFKDEVIVGVVLYGCEKALADNVKELKKYLKPGSLHKMSDSLLTSISNNVYKSFSDFTRSGTLDKFRNAPLSFNILNKESFSADLPKNKVNIFFSIEGCHSLVDSTNYIDRPDKIFPPDEILKNLDELLKEVKIVSINPTHMQQSSLCNQAFAIQITNPAPFYPHENGLTDDGRKVIQGLFDRGICVDLKHMSYKSRLDLRTEIDTRKFSNVQPLLCSHVGFTGIPFADWPGYIFSTPMPISDVYYLELAKTMQIRNLPPDDAPGFNMSTINLFNEEIVWIVKHGGMIGLSLDRRILGYVGKNDDNPTGRQAESSMYVDKEFLSRLEWSALGLEGKELGNLIDVDDCVTEDHVSAALDSGSTPRRDKYFYSHILLQLKHFLQVCFDAGIPVSEAQKHITIGSDFDGFINPFNTVQTVQDIPALKNYIQKKFPGYLQVLADSGAWASQLNITDFAENLFYNNGCNFIKDFFSR